MNNRNVKPFVSVPASEKTVLSVKHNKTQNLCLFYNKIGKNLPPAKYCCKCLKNNCFAIE